MNMTNNCTMADSDETPVLILHSKSELMYTKIYNLLVSFCFFALACFIFGLFIMKSKLQQAIQETIVEEFEKLLKKLFPGGPGNGNPPGDGNLPENSDDEDNDNTDKGTNSNNQDEAGVRPRFRESTARLVLADLERKDNQENGKKSHVFSGNGMTVKSKGTGNPPQTRPPAYSLRRCDNCGLLPYASKREHDEIFPNIASTNTMRRNQRSYFGGTAMALSPGTQMELSNEGTFEIYEVLPSSVYQNVPSAMRFSQRGYGLQEPAIVSHTMRFAQNGDPQQPAEGYLNYLGGMIHNRQENDASNNARISAYNRRNRRLWEDITTRDDLHTNVNYFRSGRNLP